MRRSCAIGAAILVGAIGIGLALLNRIAGGDGGLGSPDDGSESIEGAGKRPSPDGDSALANTGAGVDVDSSMTKAELYEIATELGLKGRSSMTKAQLLEAIRTAS